MLHRDRLSKKYRNVSDDLKEKYVAENCTILFHANKKRKIYSLQKGKYILDVIFTTLLIHVVWFDNFHREVLLFVNVKRLVIFC